MVLSVLQDTAFWQKSFATEVNATVPGYNIAAVAIFGIPWGIGTVIGLTARAIHNTPIFPTYPDDLTQAEVLAGFVMPYTIKALIGEKGLDAFFVLVFMALTSTISSSMIAVSSILSFDIYKTYLNPRASDKRLVKVSHITVVIHAVFITGVALALNYGGANITWLGYFRPVIACPGIIPLALTLLWSGQTRLAAIVAPILGFSTGLAIWLGTAQALYGRITMETTGASLPALYGAIGSFFSPALYSGVISQWKPYKFDWREFLRIELAEEAQIHTATPKSTASLSDKKSAEESTDAEPPAQGTDEVRVAAVTTSVEDPEKNAATTANGRLPAAVAGFLSPPTADQSLDEVRHPFDKETIRKLRHWEKIAWVIFVVIVLVTFVLWPMPLYRDYIFTKAFFSGWVTVAIFWQFLAFFAVVIYPLYDGRYEIQKGFRGVYRASVAYFSRKDTGS